MGKLFMGIVGGGTISTLVLLNKDGQKVGETAHVGMNVRSLEPEMAKQNIKDILKEMFVNVNVNVDDLGALCLGVSGLEAFSDELVFTNIFKELGVLCDVYITTDSDAALYGGLHKKEGVVLLCGTGSICVGYNEAGEYAKAGGWGYKMGDLGSSYDIGRRILMAVTESYDGLIGKTALTELLLEHLRIKHVTELIGIVNSYDKSHTAALAPLLTRALEIGDDEATNIMENCALELFKITELVCNKLYAGEEFDLTYSGGLIQNNRWLLHCYSEIVKEYITRAHFKAPLSGAAHGAALMALREMWREDR